MSLLTKDEIKVLRFEGAILRKDSERIESELMRTDILSHKGVILDFSRVHHICSSALGLLVSFKRRLRQSGGEVKIVVDDDDIRQVFEITMLDKVLDIYSNLHEAEETFERSEPKNSTSNQ